jgi:hypothetical protein
MCIDKAIDALSVAAANKTDCANRSLICARGSGTVSTKGVIRRAEIGQFHLKIENYRSEVFI